MNINLKALLDRQQLRAWRSWPRWVWVVLAVALLLIVWTANSVRRSLTATPDVPVCMVQRGPLAITLTESGTIQSRDKVVVRNKVEGRRTIITLLDEGKTVKKGDLLVELDASDFQRQRNDQQIAVDNTDAAVVQAREGLALILNQNQAALDQAQVEAEFARLELLKYERGENPQEVQRLEAQITLAREELQRASDKREWSRKLSKEGYVTRLELQADELAVKKCELDLQLAERALAVWKEYSFVQRISKLRSDVNQTKLAVERVKRRALADQTRAETELAAKQQEYKRQKARLDHIVEQIAQCRITAPADGLVVYVQRGNSEPLRPGQDVIERQELLYIPTAASMIAEVKIQEANLGKLRVGQPVRLKVDMLPDRVFWGHLEKIGVMPDAVDAWLNPELKLYSCTVAFDAAAQELRPGMSCQAELIVAEYEQTDYLPVQAVQRIKGQPTVYILTRRGPQERRVEVGLDNNRMIRLLSGVKPDEKVLLNPPLPPASSEGENPAVRDRPRPRPPAKAKPTAPAGSPPEEPRKASPHATPAA